MRKVQFPPLATSPSQLVNGYDYQGKFRVTTQFIDSCRVNDFTTKVSYLIYNPKRTSRGRDYPTGHSQNCDQLHSGPNPWREEAPTSERDVAKDGAEKWGPKGPSVIKDHFWTTKII